MPTALKPQFIPDFKSFEIKAVKEVEYNSVKGLFIEGQPSTFGVDRDGEQVDSKAFDNDSTVDYLKNPVILYGHAMDPIIGKKALGTVVEWKMTKTGPWIKAFIPKPVWEPMLDVYNNIKAGVLKSFSIGGIFERVKNIITKVHLFEISVEPVQSNTDALFAVAAKAFDFLKGIEDSGKAVDDHHIADAIDMQEMNNQLWRATDLMNESMRNILKDESLDMAGRMEATNNIMDEFRAIMTKIMAGAKDFDFEALESKWATGATQAGTKAGRVLSKANEAELKDALDRISAVLSKLAKEQDKE